MRNKQIYFLKFIMGMAVPIGLVVWLVLPTDLFALSLVKAFLVQILWALPVLAFLFLLKKWRILALGTILSAAVLFIYLIPYLWPEEKSGEDLKADLTVAQFNISRTNENYEEVVDLIKSVDADLISVQEVNSKWIDVLESSLDPDFKFSLSRPDETGFYGITLFSKFPAEFEELSMGTLPNIAGFCDTPFGKLSILTSHMHTPTNIRNYYQRNSHLAEVGQWAANQQNSVITMGDYNTVPWDSHLFDLKKNAGLEESRNGWQPTYPTYLAPAMIPLDYIFYSNHYECIGFERVTIPGSDHCGVVGKYRVKKSQ